MRKSPGRVVSRTNAKITFHENATVSRPERVVYSQALGLAYSGASIEQFHLRSASLRLNSSCSIASAAARALSHRKFCSEPSE